MADRCAILREGQIEQVGTPRDLYENPGNRFVAEFLGEANLLPGVVISSEATPSAGVAPSTGVGVELLPQLKETQMIEIRMGDRSGPLWRGVCQKSLEPGQKVLCCVRPEAWRIGGAPSPTANLVGGEVHSSVYLGEVTQHRVGLNGSEDVCVLVLELHQPPRDVGPVRLWVDPRDTIILA